MVIMLWKKNYDMESISTALILWYYEELTVTKAPIFVTGYLGFQLGSSVQHLSSREGGLWVDSKSYAFRRAVVLTRKQVTLCVSLSSVSRLQFLLLLLR